MSFKSILNIAVAGLGLYTLASTVRQGRRDLEDYRISTACNMRERTHNQVHTEESGIFLDDYMARMYTSFAYLDKFRDEGRPDRRRTRKVYHSAQQAEMSDAQLATLFAAALAAEHYPLDYFEIFRDQTLIFKPFQHRYVRSEELHSDAADLFKLSFKADELAEVATYIDKHLVSHKSKPVIKFIVAHRKMLLDELRHSHPPKVEEATQAEGVVA